MSYIDLSVYRRSAQSPEKTARVCDAIREELEQKDLKKYISSILTAHVVKVPPDLEAGLQLLLRLRGRTSRVTCFAVRKLTFHAALPMPETDPGLVEEAVKYIIFLVDADKLFTTALGMYDFSLALLVAQHSPKKDPREYLPFLRELKALSEGNNTGYQRFKIDDHLKRHAKALKGLHDAGTSQS